MNPQKDSKEVKAGSVKISKLPIKCMLFVVLFLLPPFGSTETGPLWVAHAGGAVDGITYLNCLEALESSYKKGFRHFELDFHWTTDGHLVLIHDWEETRRKLFPEKTGDLRDSPPTLKEFKRLKMVRGFTPTSIDELAKWHRRRADAVIVTDVKADNLKALAIIGKKLDRARVRPQVFFFEEFEPARALGFNDIILMLYRANYSDAEVVEFTRGRKLYAVAMPSNRALESGLPKALREIGARSCAQTVESGVDELTAKGVDCFYTDFFDPATFTSRSAPSNLPATPPDPMPHRP